MTTTDVKYIEVVGNDGTSKRKEAERTVLRRLPDATILGTTFFGRGRAGAPVYAVEYEIQEST